MSVYEVHKTQSSSVVEKKKTSPNELADVCTPQRGCSESISQFPRRTEKLLYSAENTSSSCSVKIDWMLQSSFILLREKVIQLGFFFFPL